MLQRLIKHFIGIHEWERCKMLFPIYPIFEEQCVFPGCTKRSLLDARDGRRFGVYDYHEVTGE